MQAVGASLSSHRSELLDVLSPKILPMVKAEKAERDSSAMETESSRSGPPHLGKIIFEFLPEK